MVHDLIEMVINLNLLQLDLYHHDMVQYFHQLQNFDHFVKRELKCKYYGRYVDDMIFFHRDKDYLKKIISEVRNYLKDNLGLELHEQKTYLQEVNKGVRFLGAIIKPGRIYAGPLQCPVCSFAHGAGGYYGGGRGNNPVCRHHRPYPDRH